jgi:arabinofuranosyltransferase
MLKFVYMNKITLAGIISLCLLIAFFLVHAGIGLGRIPGDALVIFHGLEDSAEAEGRVLDSGEQKEGCANFLWPMLLAAQASESADLSKISLYLSLICGVGILLASFSIARRFLPGLYATVPAALLAAQGAFCFWPRTGLDTTFFTLEVTFGVLIVLRELEGRRFTRLPVPSSLVFALAALTRAEGAVFFVLSLFAFYWKNRRSRQFGIIYLHLIVFIVICAGFIAGRYFYSGALPCHSPGAQAVFSPVRFLAGAKYLLAYMHQYGGVPIYFIAAISILAAHFRSREEMAPPFYFLECALVAWMAYVIFAGGDDMPFFRVICPILPVGMIVFVYGLCMIFSQFKDYKRSYIKKISLVEFAFFSVLFACMLLPSFFGG